MDVGEDTALRDDDGAEKTVQLLQTGERVRELGERTNLIVADGELEVTRDDARLLVVASGVA